MDAHLIATLKMLSDATRLRVLGLLADGRPRSAAELADALALSPRLVARHLGMLAGSGLVSVQPRPPTLEYALRPDRLAALGAALDRVDRATREPGDRLPGPDGRAGAAEETRVLRAFFVDGRLASIPAQDRKRQVVLRYLAESVFVPARDYPEKEVNQLLALRHPDVAALRRYLVDSGYLERAADIYRLRPRDTWPGVQPADAAPSSS